MLELLASPEYAQAEFYALNGHYEKAERLLKSMIESMRLSRATALKRQKTSKQGLFGEEDRSNSLPLIYLMRKYYENTVKLVANFHGAKAAAKAREKEAAANSNQEVQPKEGIEGMNLGEEMGSTAEGADIEDEMVMSLINRKVREGERCLKNIIEYLHAHSYDMASSPGTVYNSYQFEPSERLASLTDLLHHYISFHYLEAGE